ncbi:MAG: hypothetical protein FJX47_00280 [Alphaproteobacteria bacterium]|nr:hypothetical protein [Alphaproteobacteria bacterium]
MSEKGKFEIVGQPPSLEGKVKLMIGRDADELLKAAEKRIEGLKDEFIGILKRDAERLGDQMATAEKDPAGRVAAIKSIRKMAHELRGQGGTFGYPLISEVGDTLVKYIDTVQEASDNDLKIMRAHVDAIRVVQSRVITGDGGDVGRALLAELQRILARAGAEL